MDDLYLMSKVNWDYGWSMNHVPWNGPPPTTGTCNKLLRIEIFCIYYVLINDFDCLIGIWCFNTTFSYISAISWRPVLVVEEAGENHRPWASNW